MLQQTQVRTAVPYWERWMRELPNLGALAETGSERLHKLWEGLGYYTRVRNMQKAARVILEDHGGVFPARFEDVLALPGVGRYTAGAICSICYNQPAPILDGNVIRVLARVFGVAGDVREKETRAELWRLAEELVREAARLAGREGERALAVPGGACCSHLNQSLMELGALVCAPVNPLCESCPVAGWCVAFQAGRVDELPRKGRRPETTHRRFAVVVAGNRGRFLVRQRPAGVVNGHLWEFPNLELTTAKESASAAVMKWLGVGCDQVQKAGLLKHVITRYSITLEVVRVSGLTSSNAVAEGRWLPVRRLNELPFSSAHKRILKRVVEAPAMTGNAAR
jgi:A/G-specific adenine glycosylase